MDEDRLLAALEAIQASIQRLESRMDRIESRLSRAWGDNADDVPVATLHPNSESDRGYVRLLRELRSQTAQPTSRLQITHAIERLEAGYYDDLDKQAF